MSIGKRKDLMKEITPIFSVCTGFQEQRASIKEFFLLLSDNNSPPATKQTNNFVATWLAKFEILSV